MAPAGGGQQGHSDAPRRTITAGLSGLPRPGGERPAGGAGLGNTGIAPFHGSRALTAHNGNGSPWCPAPGSAAWASSGRRARSNPGSAAHARSSAALRKVAQLEGRITDRKKQMELQSAAGQKPWDEESSSSAASPEHSARGKKYLKKSAATGGNKTPGSAGLKEEENIQRPKKSVMVKQHLRLDSGEEDMRERTESSLEFSSSNDNRRVVGSDSKWGRKKSKTPVPSGMPPPSHKEVSLAEASQTSLVRSKDPEKSAFGRVNSPPPAAGSGELSVQRKMSSESPPTPVEVTLPGTRSTKQSQASLQSDTSEIKSLDELFSKAADGGDAISSSSDDFRLNILSLDDLAPNVTSEAAELKQKETDIQITHESNRNSKEDSFLVVKDQVSLKMRSAVPGVNDASERDAGKTVTEAEISEHLSGVSADFPGHKRDDLDHDERTINSEYSEDFERSEPPADRGRVSQRGQRSESRSCSGERLSPAPPPCTGEQHQRVHRVTVKETAVQTVDLPFAYCWAKTTPAALLDPPVGNSYVDPVPVASHVISTDAVEALTAYSPAALVLNAMLKQHLMLTQQFVENIHHLHLSVVESLEKEKFHYHTLEEAKEYIKTHKSPPLTTEKAREGIQKAREEKMV
ncbi:uncharacterized protein C19orf44 homolog isoform X1 [Patagioenas fasciata]|uniref:uncharacterized protein C19orf44 homolog isoform X1 n=1 Tax=Patagioenas fasciata TaxID=372321 RepID=UPI0032E8EE9C